MKTKLLTLIGALVIACIVAPTPNPSPPADIALQVAAGGSPNEVAPDILGQLNVLTVANYNDANIEEANVDIQRATLVGATTAAVVSQNVNRNITTTIDYGLSDATAPPGIMTTATATTATLYAHGLIGSGGADTLWLAAGHSYPNNT